MRGEARGVDTLSKSVAIERGLHSYRRIAVPGPVSRSTGVLMTLKSKNLVIYLQRLNKSGRRKGGHSGPLPQSGFEKQACLRRGKIFN